MICHLWSALAASDKCAAQFGDSGGPVVSYSAYGPLAVGQVVSGNCDYVLFHSVSEMIEENPHSSAVNGLHLNTTSDPG